MPPPPDAPAARSRAAAADDEQVVHVARIALRRARRQAPPASAVAVARGERAAPGGPAGEPRQPRAQDGRLHLVEPRIDAGFLMVIAIGLAAVSQPPDPLGERAIVGDDRAAVAERAEILRRIEAERAGDADRADRRGRRPSPDAPGSSPRRSPGGARAATRSIAAMSAGLAVQMHRQDRARPRPDRLGRRAPGRCVSRDGSMSANTGRAPAIMIASAVYAADSGVVMTSSPGPMPSARRISAMRVGAGADADRVRRAGRRRELCLERLDLRAEHEPAARDDAIDRRANGVRVFAGRQRQERDASGRSRELWLRRARRVDVVVEVLAVERDRSLQAVAQRDGGRPAGGAHELRRVGVEAADVDRPSSRPATRRTRTRPDPATSTSSAVRSRWLIGSSPPTLNTSPLQASSAPARRNASAASST